MPLMSLKDITFDDDQPIEGTVPLSSIKFDDEQSGGFMPLSSIKFDDPMGESTNMRRAEREGYGAGNIFPSERRTAPEPSESRFIPQQKFQPEDFSQPISTITGKPVPTAEERFRQSDWITSAPASAAGMVGGLGTGIGAGYIGLLRLISTGDIDKAKAMMDEINAQPAKFIKTPEQAKVVENISNAIMYLPAKGKEGWGLIAEYADAELQKMGSAPTYLKPVMETIGEAAVFALYPAVKASITRSNWYRMLSNEQRALVVQSLDDAIRNNPKMTEGEILRKWGNAEWREQALAKRAKGEAPPPEAGTTAMPVTPPVTPSGGSPAGGIVPLDKVVFDDVAAPVSRVAPTRQPSSVAKEESANAPEQVYPEDAMVDVTRIANGEKIKIKVKPEEAMQDMKDNKVTMQRLRDFMECLK